MGCRLFSRLFGTFLSLLLGSVYFQSRCEGAATAANDHGLIVITLGDVGIRRGDDFYSIGMQAGQFTRGFGWPAKQTAARLEYPEQGLTVLLNPDGEIAAFSLTADQSPTAANATQGADGAWTAKDGLQLKMRLDVVRNRLGQPEEQVQQPGYRRLVYPFGELEFRTDRLVVIQLGFNSGEHDRLIQILRASRQWHEWLLHRNDPKPMAATAPAPPPPPLLFPITDEMRKPFRELASARRIVFVIDASGSMLNRFGWLRRVWGEAVKKLNDSQEFSVIVFQGEGAQLFPNFRILFADPQFETIRPPLHKPTLATKEAALTWIEEKIVPRGETKPLPALKLAINQKPDRIYFLTDGDFANSQSFIQSMRELSKDHPLKISTIEFTDSSNPDGSFFSGTLQAVAKDSGGTFTLLTGEDP